MECLECGLRGRPGIYDDLKTLGLVLFVGHKRRCLLERLARRLFGDEPLGLDRVAFISVTPTRIELAGLFNKFDISQGYIIRTLNNKRTSPVILASFSMVPLKGVFAKSPVPATT